MTDLIAQSESKIATLQNQLDQLQERHDLLKATETMHKSVLWQVGRTIEMLNKLSPDQVAIFKSEIDAKFEAAEWRSKWDARIGEMVLHEPNSVEAFAAPSDYVKINKKLNLDFDAIENVAAIFGERVKQYRQFLLIQKELVAIGIKFDKLISNFDDLKSWQLDWHGKKAGLFWTVGAGWSIDPLRLGGKLTGQWENFDLYRQLECNGIDLDSKDEELVV